MSAPERFLGFYIHPWWSHHLCNKGTKLVAGKSRMRPSFKKHTKRYREVIAPAKTLEGLKNLTKKQRYANRHG
jgi:hypothetical protein